MSRTIIVSNRVPVPSSGPQAGGLAVVLRDLLEQRGGVWFGWSGQISDGTTTTTVQRGRVKYATIDLSQAEHEGFYNGFSNSVLWPLLHMMPGLVKYVREDAETYAHVNTRMADALAALVEPDDIIWVQDYHLFSLPAALRARGLRNPIGFFLHIPFPPAAMLSMVPGMDRLVRDVMAADLVGLQTRHDATNFEAAACAMVKARSVAPGLLSIGRGIVHVDVFPVEIEPDEFSAIAVRAGAGTAAARLVASLQGQHLILGVDRLDPSKGLPERLKAFGRLLQRYPEWRGHITLLQIAASSRTEVDAYRSLRHQLEGIAGRINADYGEAHWTPIRLITTACDRETVAGYMRHARIGLVTPLHDGMNLVAKEYVAAQDAANPGVLVLSRFAGAADQLADALLVNPNDRDSITEALHTALRMDVHTRQARWTRLWDAIKDRSAPLWGDSFLRALDTARGDIAAANDMPDTATAAAEAKPAPTRVMPLPVRPAGRAAPIIHHPFGHHRSDRTH
jgi:trehalose 6-phosphate synthase